MSDTIKYDAWLLEQLVNKNQKCKFEKMRSKSASTDCKTCVGAIDSKSTQTAQSSQSSDKNDSAKKAVLYPWEQEGFNLFMDYSGELPPQQALTSQPQSSQSMPFVNLAEAETTIFNQALIAAAKSKTEKK